MSGNLPLTSPASLRTGGPPGTRRASTPHDFDEATRRVSSCIRAGVRATSMPPLWVKTPSSLYWLTLSSVKAAISFEWSVRKMKFEA